MDDIRQPIPKASTRFIHVLRRDMRLNEWLSLRIKDLDFELYTLTVRSGKGNKDRTTLLPQSMKESLQEQIEYVERVYRRDLQDGYGGVYMPYALARNYPSTARELGWQFLFPATSIGRGAMGVIRPVGT